MRGQAPHCRWLMAGGCTLMAAAALATALAWGRIFDNMLSSQVVLSPTSRAYKDWVAPDVPLYFDVYLLNWTNADVFPNEVPNFQEIGPYRFREYRSHVNVTWHPNNGSVGYRTHRSWQFEAESSNGTLEDNITTLNVIAASAVFRSRYWGFLQQKGLSMGLAMFGQEIHVSKTSGELLFDGYEDPLLDLAKSLPSSATGGAPPIDRFGWFYSRNNSIDSDGYMEVTTGAGGELPGQILKWNFDESLPFYSGECSQLVGSAGEFLPRNMTQSSKLTMFVADLCRTLHMEFKEEGSIQGLPYYKYAINEDSFDVSHPCFCSGDCSWSGVMNVSACRYGSPAFISLPHFLYADQRLSNLVTGLKPDPAKHDFYFAVEPKLGVPLDVAARFQLNIFMESSPNIMLYENVPNMLFPILWVEQKVLLEDKIIEELLYARSILDWGPTIFGGIALIFLIIVVLGTCCFKTTYYRKPETIITLEKPKDEAELKLNPTSF